MIQYISFDLDGTLSNELFDKILWNEELPRIYAATHNVDLESAKKHVYAEFYRALYIEKVPKFTDVGYWFQRHQLSGWQALIESMSKYFTVYPDVHEIFPLLSRQYKLILLTSTEEKMLTVKLGKSSIKDYFYKIYSTPTNFNISLKSKAAYKKVLSDLGINPSQIIHVGNEYHVDYENPMSVGIQAYHIVRDRTQSGSHIIHTLYDLQNKLESY